MLQALRNILGMACGIAYLSWRGMRYAYRHGQPLWGSPTAYGSRLYGLPSMVPYYHAGRAACMLAYWGA